MADQTSINLQFKVGEEAAFTNLDSTRDEDGTIYFAKMDDKIGYMYGRFGNKDLNISPKVLGPTVISNGDTLTIEFDA